MNLKKILYDYPFDFWLIIITPIIDTINGIFLIKYGATGMSIGTFYRLFIIFYLVLKLRKNRIISLMLIPLIYYPIIGFIRGFSGDNLFGCITYAAKWLMPILIISYFAFFKKNKDETVQYLMKILEFWSVYVPVSLIVEFIFNIGQASYYNAGFKGLYYSTNDLALVLIICFTYSFWKALHHSRRNYLITLLCFISIIILSTKSSLFFSIISSIYLVLTSHKLKFSKRYLLLFIICSIIFIICTMPLLSDFFTRYSSMWNGTEGYGILDRILIFATSGRMTRIKPFFDLIHENGNIFFNFLFGWIYPDNAHVVEMDWHDLFYQYGLIGFFIFFSLYVHLILKCKIRIKPLGYIVLLCLIYSIFAGHVINGAFSGTIFAVCFSILILSSNTLKENNS